MKIYTTTLLLILLYCTNINAQGQVTQLLNSIDSLEKIKNNKITLLKTQIRQHGLEQTANRNYRITSSPNSVLAIDTIPKGEKFLVFYKEEIFYRVKYKETYGFVFLYGGYKEFPMTLLQGSTSSNTKQTKEQSYSNSFSSTNSKSTTKTNTSKPYKSYRSSSVKCRTVQCSGRTKKGRRCKRRTTKCSGRCHSH